MADCDSIEVAEKPKINDNEEVGKDIMKFIQNFVDQIRNFIYKPPESEIRFKEKVNLLDATKVLYVQELIGSNGEEEEHVNVVKKPEIVAEPGMDRLEKKIELLQRLLERKNVELETARSCKETSDQEVKKYELLFAIDEEALEIEVFATQDQISKIVAAFETLKNQQGVTRAGFTNHMISVNNRISKLVTKSVQRPNIVTFVGNIGIPFTGSMCSIFAIYLMVKWRNRDEEIMLTQQRIIYSKSVSFGERLLQEIQRPWWGWYWWGKVEKKMASNQVVFKTQPLEYFYH